MKKIIVLITILFLFPINAYAQSNTQADQIQGVLTSIEEERSKKLKEELGVVIPLETDNPNHIITFKDPSGKGVKIELDGQGFKAIKSPYTLPSIGIGSHVLTFGYTDQQGAAKTLETELVVVPRPPVINAPEIISKGEFLVKGTSLASSSVEIFISGDTLHFKGITEVGADGSWSYRFKENFKYTVYTIIARTKKNGFSSSISEPIVFEMTNSEKPGVVTNITRPIYFDFREFNPGNVLSNLKNNPHILLLIGLSAILGGLITWGIESISSRKVNKTAEGKFIKLLNEKGNVKDNKSVNKKGNDVKEKSSSLTLKEKFQNAGFKMPIAEIKEKEITKQEFLEAYKEQDPDNAKGVEKKDEPKIEKKKVAVSLTSRKI
jgi:hypothetical protein